jgi:ectoine hydroxylase-related dioxygenase (phytanoyl-CoA dioxygenase family)
MNVRVRPTFGQAGFLVQEAALDRDEVGRLRAVVEDVAARVATRARREGAGPEARMANGARIQFSSHTNIQWEWAHGSEQIRLLEPCDHLDPAIAELFDDERLVGPARTALGLDAVAPFTSKLNLKRAREGSEFPWHQDYPYWYAACREDAADMVTAIVFLDDADAGNGALRVLPGSHLGGPARRDRAEPTQFLADAATLDTAHEVVVEVPAGSVIWFGSFLVHRSSPNTSGRDRRALLPTWQPTGRPRLFEREYRRELVEELP